MSADANKTVVRRLYEEVFGSGRLDLADELVDPDARDARDVQDRRGPAWVKEVASMLRMAFPTSTGTSTRSSRKGISW